MITQLMKISRGEIAIKMTGTGYVVCGDDEEQNLNRKWHLVTLW